MVCREFDGNANGSMVVREEGYWKVLFTPFHYWYNCLSLLDGLCILWRLQDATSGVPSFGKEEGEEDDKETWSAFKTLR